MPECFDVENCCKLLEDYNIILSEDGVQDYETASSEIDKEEPKRCSFCGKILESGRFVKFEDGRLVCAECDKTSVRTQEELDTAVNSAREYLTEKYPEILFGVAEVKFLDGKFSSQYFSKSGLAYRVDVDNRVIYVQRETPMKSIERAVIRATVELWQNDNELLIALAEAQVEYEELQYLNYIGYTEKAAEVESKLEGYVIADINEIKAFVGDGSNAATSFAFMRKTFTGMSSQSEPEEPTDGTDPVELYDPNKIPRFWKRYLRGQSVTEGEDKLSTDERTEEDPVEPVEEVASTEEPEDLN